MLTQELIVSPKKSEQALCFTLDTGSYLHVLPAEWSSKSAMIADLPTVEVFRPYRLSPRITLSSVEFLTLMAVPAVGSKRARQHAKTARTRAWSVLWATLERWPAEDALEVPNTGFDLDEMVRGAIRSAFEREKREAALTAFDTARCEGWGAHEATVRLMLCQDNSELRLALPKDFFWEPEGTLVR